MYIDDGLYSRTSIYLKTRSEVDRVFQIHSSRSGLIVSAYIYIDDGLYSSACILTLINIHADEYLGD